MKTDSTGRISLTDAEWQAENLPRARPYRLLRDDPRFGLVAGDVLLCIPYWLDPEKVTVVARQSDGFYPGCNQYREHVERLPRT